MRDAGDKTGPASRAPTAAAGSASAAGAAHAAASATRFDAIDRAT